LATIYRSKEEYIEVFDELTRQYSQVTSEVIGYSVQGRAIKMYRIGDPRGGKVLYDGQIHGCSCTASEMLYLYAKWLLQSGDAAAQRILNRNCTLIIPVFNIDSYGRKNTAGVDLNRNFEYNWQNSGSPDPTSDYYHGPSALSEPESQAVKAVFEREKPFFYLNFHTFGGPWIGSFTATAEQRNYCTTVASLWESLMRKMGIEIFYPYTEHSLGNGYAVSDAAVLGINSFLNEILVSGATPQVPPLAEFETVWFPRWLPIAITLSEECGKDLPQGFPFELALAGLAILLAIT